MYCQRSELCRNQAQLVTWNAVYFRQVNAAIHVPKRDTINTALAGDNDAVFLGPFGDDDAGTEVIHICRTCYVPPAYMGMFLEGPMSPRAVWEMVIDHILTQGRQLPCTALIDFVRAAMTRSGVQALPILCVAPPHAPLADRDLLED